MAKSVLPDDGLDLDDILRLIYKEEDVFYKLREISDSAWRQHRNCSIVRTVGASAFIAGTIAALTTAGLPGAVHVFTIGVSPSPLCECGSEESPAHVVADCPIHVMNRLLHLQQAIIHETELKDLNYQSVLSFFMATGTIVGSNSKVLQGTE